MSSQKIKYRIEELDPEFFAKTTPEMGWASLSNGNLLSVAEKEFDVLLKYGVYVNNRLKRMTFEPVINN